MPLRAGAGFGSSPGFQTVAVLWIGPWTLAVMAVVVGAVAGWIVSKPLNHLLGAAFRAFNAGFNLATGAYTRAVGQVKEQGVIDVLGITGYYTMLAMVMNTARTPLPDGVKPPLAPLAK